MSSVTQNNQKQNTMTVHMKARKLAVYTLNICKNKNVFNPEYNFWVTDKIVSNAMDIFLLAWRANDILVKTAEDYKQRRQLQQESILACDQLLALMNLAKPLFHLTGNRVKYWAGLTIEVRDLLRAWRNSDSNRYRHLE